MRVTGKSGQGKGKEEWRRGKCRGEGELLAGFGSEGTDLKELWERVYTTGGRGFRGHRWGERG